MGFGGGEGLIKGESRWHGVCLALAEMARRGLVKDDAVGEAIPWVMKVSTMDDARSQRKDDSDWAGSDI